MPHFKTILLAEDDPAGVRLTLEALAELKIANEIDVVEDGEEALDYLHRRGQHRNRVEGNPVLILLDLKMPKVNGLEVLREIKQEESLKTIPVVVLTSSREESDLVASYQLGVNAYVVKPVDYVEFVRTVKDLGVFWALINEAPPTPRRPADKAAP